MSDEVRIVHAADVHLDSPLRGLSRLGDSGLAEELRLATRLAFQNLVDHVAQARPAALILAGDLYDRQWEDVATGTFFARQMLRLHDEGIPVVMVKGNHDAKGVVTKVVSLPDNVHDMRTDSPDLVDLADSGLVVHGQGFQDRAVPDNLALHYPPAVPGVVNVGVLHTSAGGYAGHDEYSPCSVEYLVSKGYDYFALGHVHQRAVLADGQHTVAFSGNLQGRHVRESGPKGALNVTIRPGSAASVDFVELDVARWEHLFVDVSGVDDYDDVLARVDAALGAARSQAGTRPLVVRITVTGTAPVAADLQDDERLEAECGTLAWRNNAVLEDARNESVLPVSGTRVTPEERDLIAAAAARLDLTATALRTRHAKLDAKTQRLLRSTDLEPLASGDELRQSALQALVARLEGGLS